MGVEYKTGTTTVTPSDEGKDSGENKYHDETITVQLTQNIYAGGATANKIKSLEKSLEIAKKTDTNLQFLKRFKMLLKRI